MSTLWQDPLAQHGKTGQAHKRDPAEDVRLKTASGPETPTGQSQGSPFEQTEGNLPGQQVRATARASEAKK